ncbi:MAG TPA: hypothetical protein DCR21_00395 [Succinivibrionaceae bacterium]|nr:hypothetical protein [Succinivibrionaceae bacterium]
MSDFVLPNGQGLFMTGFGLFYQSKASPADCERTNSAAAGEIADEKTVTLKSDISAEINRCLEEKKDEQREREEEKAEKVSSIKSKLMSGKTLSSSEKEYLRVADPVTYNSIMAAENERRHFERKLKECRTKEEVEDLKLGRLANSMTNMQSIEKADFPPEEKEKYAAVENYRLNGYVKSTEKFRQSKEYKELPTIRERQIYEEEEQKAKLEQLRENASADDKAVKAESSSPDITAGDDRSRQEVERRQKIYNIDGEILTYDKIIKKVKKSLMRYIMPNSGGTTPTPAAQDDS